MSRLNPQKLSVKFMPGVTPTKPIIPRRYTLTHSDITGELFLDVGRIYSYDKINSMRDEVLAQWIKCNGKYHLNIYLYISGGDFELAMASMRYKIFQKELPLALEAIRFGDRHFFECHPILDKAPIFIYFKSIYPQYNKIEYWGTPSDYRLK